jgi:hypothetical protein
MRLSSSLPLTAEYDIPSSVCVVGANVAPIAVLPLGLMPAELTPAGRAVLQQVFRVSPHQRNFLITIRMSTAMNHIPKNRSAALLRAVVNPGRCVCQIIGV